MAVLDLAAERGGSGEPPVVLLHGFTGAGASMVDLGSRLGRRFVCPDLVGHGHSAAPDDIATYSMDAMVDQIERLVANEARFDLVGYSMGARTALSFAVAHPSRVRRLVLIGGTAGIEEPAERGLRVRADHDLADRIERNGIEAFVDHWQDLPIFVTQKELPVDVQERVRAGRMTNRPIGLANHLRGAGTGAMPSLWDALRSLELRVLLVVGERDEKFTTIARNMADRLPSAEVNVVAGVGHAAHLEAPDAVAGVVAAFLDRA